MEGRCKKCEKEERVKNGYVKGKQRYKCKGCGQSYREGDLRERYIAKPLYNSYNIEDE